MWGSESWVWGSEFGVMGLGLGFWVRVLSVYYLCGDAPETSQRGEASSSLFSSSLSPSALLKAERYIFDREPQTL